MSENKTEEILLRNIQIIDSVIEEVDQLEIFQISSVCTALRTGRNQLSDILQDLVWSRYCQKKRI